MTDEFWIGCMSAICWVFGLAKVLRPQLFLALRERYPWMNFFDLYAFAYKKPNAEKIVRFNGTVLIATGFALTLRVIFS